jgi:hypothetical protein
MCSELSVINQDLIRSVAKRPDNFLQVVVREFWINHSNNVVKFKLCHKAASVTVDLADPCKYVFEPLILRH